MKPRIKSMIWNIRKKKISNQYSKKEKKIKKKKIKDSVRSRWNNCKCFNIHIIGVRREKEQEIRNLFGKKLKENFPNLVKEIDIQVQEAQRDPNKMDTRRTTPRHNIIKITKVKDKERILKATRE